jgi:enolase
MMNILNGGKHAEAPASTCRSSWSSRSGAGSYREGLRWGTEVFHALKDVLHGRGLPTGVGDEGGYAPSLPSNEAAVEIILEAIAKTGYGAGTDLLLALDPAATEFYADGSYVLAGEGRTLSGQEMVAFWTDWAARYPIASIEDGLAEDDWAGWTALRAQDR